MSFPERNLNSNSNSESNDNGWRLSKDGRQIHRFRKKRYANGDTYEGEFVNGIRDGNGTLLQTTAGATIVTVYRGEFANGQFHGRGVLEQSHRDRNLYSNQLDKVQLMERYEGSFQKGERHGFGILVDANGAKWEGSWQHNQFDGQGSCRDADGGERTGTWRRGKLHGQDVKIQFSDGGNYRGPVSFGKLHGPVGRLEYSPKTGGGTYDGEFWRGFKHGVGTRRYVDGSVYRGDFVEDVVHGTGVMHYSHSSGSLLSYDGQWEDGRHHGFGELLFRADDRDKESYRGHFHRGLMNGKGKLTYRDGGFFEGEFLNGRRHGHGLRRWSSGNTFHGTWDNDQMVAGTYHDVCINSKYVGAFVNNKKHGQGRQTWQSPDGKDYKDPCLKWNHSANDGPCTYDGHYQHGCFHGHGRFQAPDGRYYDGEWKHGKRSGQGTAMLLSIHQLGDPDRMAIGPHGSLYRPIMYDGQWHEDQRHGWGIITYLDHSQRQGNFVRGHLDGEVTIKFKNQRTGQSKEVRALYCRGTFLRYHNDSLTGHIEN